MATDTEFYDELETRSADARAASLAECLPAAVAHARDNAPGYAGALDDICLLYTSPSPRDRQKSRMPSSA